MKRQWKGFVSGFFTALLILGISVPAFAAYQKHAALSYNNIKVMVDGSDVPLADASGNKVEPFIMDGTTYLPARAIADATGYNVGWNATTNTVELTDKYEYADWCYSEFSLPSFDCIVGFDLLFESKKLSKDQMGYAYNVSSLSGQEISDSINLYKKKLIEEYGFYTVESTDGKFKLYNPMSRTVICISSVGKTGVVISPFAGSDVECAYWDKLVK